MKLFAVLMFCISVHFTANAQKLYNTTTAQIKIVAKKEADKRTSVSNLAESRWLENNGQFFLTTYLIDLIHESNQDRTAFVTNVIENEKYPKLVFKGFLQDIQRIDLINSGGTNIVIEGSLNLHGITQNISLIGTLTVLSSGKILINAESSLKWKDFNVSNKAFLTLNGNEFRLSLYAIYE